VIDPASVSIPSEPTNAIRRELIARLRGALENADPGTLAALRRADPTSPPAAFYRLAITVLDEHLTHVASGGPRRDALEARWAAIVSAMATARKFLEPPVPLGKALATAGVTEMRLLRLLEASSTQLPELLRNLVHLLVQKGQPFDPNDLANLVLARDDDRGPRRDIARSFYRHYSA
jgi:CRISPR type I-E-associated protein CasB/Cse2